MELFGVSDGQVLNFRPGIGGPSAYFGLNAEGDFIEQGADRVMPATLEAFSSGKI